ncbi:hypothetical protein [Rhodoplanes sp. SY1]|uniref:hypothetical protein n=1 Tax=Rhodoplanes sp. SY1 TaxID=3166646 RepID=UPI0038B4C9F3
MNRDEIEAELAALRGELSRTLTGGSITGVRDGEREVTLRPASPAEIRQRIAELEGVREGRAGRTRGRAVVP